jgi:hypothetical protein
MDLAAPTSSDHRSILGQQIGAGIPQISADNLGEHPSRSPKPRREHRKKELP